MSEQTLSEMESDIEQYGKRSVEAGQGFVPMAEPLRPEPETERDATLPRAYSSDNDWRHENDGAPSIVERHYHTPGSDETRPRNESVELERAVRDLGEIRKTEFEIDAALRDVQLAEQVEALRSPLAKEVAEAQAATPEPQQQQAQEAQQQPEAQPVDPVAKALEDPRVLSAVMQQRQRDLAEGQRAVQHAAAVVEHNARVAVASIFARFPEVQQLANMSPPQQQAAMQMLAQSNPQRFQDIQREYAGIQQVLQADAQIKQHQAVQAAQRYQAEWSQWSADEDAKFTARHPEMNDPAKQPQIAQRAQAYMENIGFSKDDIARAWHGQASVNLRDHRAQSIIMDAMRYREAIAGVPNARANPVAKVQRPGTSVERAPAGDVDLRTLFDKLAQTGSARDAAALLSARRARSR